MPLTEEVQSLLDNAVEELHQGKIDIDEFRERLLENGFSYSEISDILAWEGIEE